MTSIEEGKGEINRRKLKYLDGFSFSFFEDKIVRFLKNKILGFIIESPNFA